MDVRCERCRAQYVLDDDQVTPAGLTVQCTHCGHLFKVKKKQIVVTVPVKPGEVEGTPIPASAAAPRAAGPRPSAPSLRAAAEPPREPAEPERAREWRVRQASGSVLAFRELTTLQKWIVERKVGRDDEISPSGDQWRRLGDIAELASFFEVVEAAERARARPAPTPLPSGHSPPAVHEVDLGMDHEPPLRRGGSFRWVVAAILVAVAGGGAWLVVPLLAVPSSPPPEADAPRAPETVAVPITIEARPVAPPVEPPPERAPPAEPVAPPDPAAAKPAPPRGPKQLLARARALLGKGDARAALELYGRVASEDPANVEAQVGRGLCYLDLEAWAPAEASFQAALRIEPDDADALLGLAETYRFQGKKAEAVASYERYLSRYPGGDEAEVAKNALAQLRN